MSDTNQDPIPVQFELQPTDKGRTQLALVHREAEIVRGLLRLSARAAVKCEKLQSKYLNKLAINSRLGPKAKHSHILTISKSVKKTADTNLKSWLRRLAAGDVQRRAISQQKAKKQTRKYESFQKGNRTKTVAKQQIVASRGVNGLAHD